MSILAGALGLLNLVTALGRPSVSNMRGVDVVHLLGVGVLFGVALVTFFLFLFRARRR
jgi:hypothetical protein